MNKVAINYVLSLIFSLFRCHLRFYPEFYLLPSFTQSVCLSVCTSVCPSQSGTVSSSGVGKMRPVRLHPVRLGQRVFCVSNSASKIVRPITAGKCVYDGYTASMKVRPIDYAGNRPVAHRCDIFSWKIILCISPAAHFHCSTGVVLSPTVTICSPVVLLTVFTLHWYTRCVPAGGQTGGSLTAVSVANCV